MPAALSFDEAMNLLSGVRLGVGIGLIPGVSIYTMNKLLFTPNPRTSLPPRAFLPTTPISRFTGRT